MITAIISSLQSNLSSHNKHRLHENLINLTNWNISLAGFKGWKYASNKISPLKGLFLWQCGRNSLFCNICIKKSFNFDEMRSHPYIKLGMRCRVHIAPIVSFSLAWTLPAQTTDLYLLNGSSPIPIQYTLRTKRLYCLTVHEYSCFCSTRQNVCFY